MLSQFARNLRYLRKRSGLRQTEMLKSLGFSQARWSSWEVGKARPNLDDFMKIAHYFNISETDLLHSELSAETQHIYSPQLSSEDFNRLKKLLAYQEEEIKRLKQKLKSSTDARQKEKGGQ